MQDDFKAKLTEVAGLRADNEKNKQTAKDSEEAKKLAEDKVKELEKELKQYRNDKDKVSHSLNQIQRMYTDRFKIIFSILVLKNS